MHKLYRYYLQRLKLSNNIIYIININTYNIMITKYENYECNICFYNKTLYKLCTCNCYICLDCINNLSLKNTMNCIVCQTKLNYKTKLQELPLIEKKKKGILYQLICCCTT